MLYIIITIVRLIYYNHKKKFFQFQNSNNLIINIVTKNNKYYISFGIKGDIIYLFTGAPVLGKELADNISVAI